MAQVGLRTPEIAPLVVDRNDLADPGKRLFAIIIDGVVVIGPLFAGYLAVYAISGGFEPSEILMVACMAPATLLFLSIAITCT